jgi:hypothetical protein
MRILRLGYTETTLFFYYWLDKVKHVNAYDFTRLDIRRDNLINWLYSTSGFYDKSIQGTYFNFNENSCLLSDVYNQYMVGMIDRIKNTDLILSFHRIPEYFLEYKKNFLIYIETITKSVSFNYTPTSTLYENINNKKVLIVNPMASLMKEQYDSERLSKIRSDFPKLADISYIENPYTFLNNGPDENILKTASKLCKEISTKEFDVAIISCGAYSSILTHHIIHIMGKDAVAMGGELLTLFGIKIGRDKTSSFNEYWISVPDHLKPNDYMKIENGCYW